MEVKIWLLVVWSPNQAGNIGVGTEAREGTVQIRVQSGLTQYIAGNDTCGNLNDWQERKFMSRLVLTWLRRQSS